MNPTETFGGEPSLHRSRFFFRTTVVMTTSPLLLERCDEVAFLEDGAVTDVGAHRTLMHTNPRYRAVVTRGESELADAGEPS